MSFVRLLLALLLLCLAFSAAADDTPVSPTRARVAVKAGLIKPLEELLSTVAQRYEGRVIVAELHENGGLWSYEFEMLPANGSIFGVEVDAATGRVLRTRGPAQGRR